MSLFGKKNNDSLVQSYNKTYGMPTLSQPSDSNFVSPTYIDFTPTREINSYLAIDDDSKRFALRQPKLFGTPVMLCSIPYRQLLSFELLEDGHTVTKGGLGMAAVGALTFGSAGAIVGSVMGSKATKRVTNSLRIKITLVNISLPPKYITLISTKTKCDSLIYATAYNDAQNILSVFSQISNQVDAEEHTNYDSTIDAEASSSVADEIRKFKELMDEGIITEEEFKAKKTQLLDL